MLSSRLSAFPNFRGFVRLPQIRCMTLSHHDEIEKEIERIQNLPAEEKAKLDERARNKETVVPGGTGGKSLEAQIILARGKVARSIHSPLISSPMQHREGNEVMYRVMLFEELAKLGMSIREAVMLCAS
jgi:hypothetical protein